VRREIERLEAAGEPSASITEPLNAIMIDFFLWDYAKANSDAMAHIPIHKTSSIFY